MLQVFLIFLLVTVSCLLSTTGSPEYRVVQACQSETCKNNKTEKMFEQNDICEPSSFADCTGCPKAQCVFHQFNPSTLGYFLQVANLVAIVWLLYFVNSLGCLMMATVFGVCYAGNRRAEDLSKYEIWISFRTTCCYHLGKSVCAWYSWHSAMGVP